MNGTRLTPDQALARFGELTTAAGEHRVHSQFEAPEGDWRPEFDADMKLTGYRLFRRPEAAPRVIFRRKHKP